MSIIVFGLTELYPSNDLIGLLTENFAVLREIMFQFSRKLKLMTTRSSKPQTKSMIVF